MKNLLHYCFILLLLFIYTESSGQLGKSIYDNNVEWHFKKECWAKNAELEIFKVIETPPLLTGVSQIKFKSDIKKLIKNNNQHSGNISEIKIRIFTIVNHGVCIAGVLASNGTDKELIKQVYQYIERFENIKPGKQRGREQNCLSEI